MTKVQAASFSFVHDKPFLKVSKTLIKCLDIFMEFVFF